MKWKKHYSHSTSIRNCGPILAVCGPKFTKLSVNVQEWSQFATPFSVWQSTLSRSTCICDQVTKLSEIEPEISMFSTAKVFDGGAQISDRILSIWVIIEHVPKSGDWWRLTEWPRRVGGEKWSKHQQQNITAGSASIAVGYKVIPFINTSLQ